MTDSNFEELVARIDAIGQTVLRLIAQLETDNRIDGPRFSQTLLRVAAARHREPEPVHVRCGEVMQQLAQMLDEARARRLRERGQEIQGRWCA
ncbi:MULTISPECIES: hypothetical protein [Burkholderia cepacia complex]|uniref:hypothetical protein n=1 Tax=Burkholderia cepacia complex TaxID=87882 RepID=UPI000BA5EF4A|nr:MULTISPECIES: hypothetical protein [Burkholderia cepacia complex]PAK13977.1 hypothetical protein CJO66_13530 [Burkholderia ubonensis]RQQ00166.1 hypothetical protein DF009_01980 [Burkholderia ubonensis]RQQ49148.1 hypothetical protein DF145_16170 [Burkholderia stagnalis]RQY00041.1 hypothetical protein DF121_16295 [Burkholderia stagnalis]RQY14527.1 hypothetical protein DF115_19265 [Burkholderia stagnalis]